MKIFEILVLQFFLFSFEEKKKTTIKQSLTILFCRRFYKRIITIKQIFKMIFSL